MQFVYNFLLGVKKNSGTLHLIDFGLATPYMNGKLHILMKKRNNLIKAFYKQLTSNNKKTRINAAKAWSTWEARTSKLIQTKKVRSKIGITDGLLIPNLFKFKHTVLNRLCNIYYITYI